jgi:hypothetical protein
MYCPRGADGEDCPIDLIGFSKSGWGALSLLLSNTSVYRKVAAWDAPSMLSVEFCDWMLGQCNATTGCLWDMMANIGDCKAWASCAPHSLVPSASSALKVASAPRIFLGGQHYFGNWPGQQKQYAAAPGAP